MCLCEQNIGIGSHAPGVGNQNSEDPSESLCEMITYITHNLAVALVKSRRAILVIESKETFGDGSN